MTVTYEVEMIDHNGTTLTRCFTAKRAATRYAENFVRSQGRMSYIVKANVREINEWVNTRGRISVKRRLINQPRWDSRKKAVYREEL